MSDIKVGSKWVCKNDCVDVVEVIGVYSQIRYQLIGGSIYVMDKKDFLGTFNPAPIITVGDVVLGEVSDAINPDHYQSDPSGVQCIEISENWSFCLGNALKYMWRSGKKDSSKNIEDLQKAVWYIEREISRLSKDSE